jgi:hypothetical protein
MPVEPQELLVKPGAGHNWSAAKAAELCRAELPCFTAGVARDSGHGKPEASAQHVAGN